MNPSFEPIADGLAADGYAIVDQFLAPSEVNAILELEAFKSGIALFKKAGVGAGNSYMINESIRGDHVRWIDHQDPVTELKAYFNRLTSLREHINSSLFLSLKDFEVHFTIYPTGSFYKRHLDQFKGDDHRRLSIILYLNKEWREEHGGQLRLHLAAGPFDVLPIAGRLVCFRSDKVEHEVLPASRERLSITGWMLDQYSGLRHL